MLKYSSTDTPPVRPRELQFGLLSAEEIARTAVCKITETTLYYRGLPASNGLLDPLMGTVDPRHKCATCMNDTLLCQGHLGYIALAYPVYHLGFLDYVLKTLRCVCFACSRLVATEEEVEARGEREEREEREESREEPEDGSGECCLPCEEGRDKPGERGGERGKARLAAWHALLRSRKACPHCGLPRPSVVRTALGIGVEWPVDAEWESEEERAFFAQPFTAREAFSVLRHVSDADVRSLGFDPRRSHPSRMILVNLVVPPPCTRPAVYSTEGSRSRGQNDLTVRFLEILRRSHEVEAHLKAGSVSHWEDAPAASPELLERLARLQYEVHMLVNSGARIPKPAGMGRNSSNANSKGLHDRLRGKEGRVRGNLMGKRVDFSARCVITPDAYFECDRVGVPYKIAKSLTFPEMVHARNIRSLARRVQLGAESVHGAQSVLHAATGEVTDLALLKDERARANVVLRFGDVVARHLADDDLVVFNRQPSLHMHSMQCHRVRLMPGHTFRISLPVAAPYNADFDGDEMNLHVPQSHEAAAECALLMGVGQNCIGPQGNRPVMGIVQDSLLGLHLLSQHDVLLGHGHACRLLGATRHAPRTLPPPAVVVVDGTGRTTVRAWTGKQLFSHLLPPDLYVEPAALPLPPSSSFPSFSSLRDADLPVVVREGRLLCGVLRKAHVGTGAGGIVDTLCRDKGGIACLRFMGDAQRATHEFLLQRGHHVGIQDVMLSPEGHERVTERLGMATRLCEEIQREVDDSSPADAKAAAEGAIVRLLSKTLLQTGGIVNEHMSERNAIRRMVTAGSKGSFINLSQICAALGQQSLEGGRIVAEKGHRTLPCFAPNDPSLASRGMVLNSFSLGLSPSELYYHAIGGREGLVDTAVKTSQTGYLQRRMNKSMEDNSIHASDGTVRNSLGEVISFRWGSDGLHPARVERAKVSLLLESPASIRARMTDEEAERALESREAVLRVKTHVLVEATGGGVDARVLLPFSPDRVRHRIARERARTREEEVDPLAAGKRALALAREAPHAVSAALLDVLCASAVRGMDASCHASLLAHLEARLAHARATAGESVGCIAAQSVGEPSTQMTLNSVDWHTTMVLRWTGKVPPPAPAEGEVGAFVDALILSRPDEVQLQPDGVTVYLPLPPGTAVALSPDEEGRMKWTPLEAVTRHPPINKDGSNTLVEVTTESGRTVVVTKGKSLLVERGGKLVEADGDAVRVGDRVPVVHSLPSDDALSHLDLGSVFLPTEVVFTDVMVEAVEAASKNYFWFSQGGFRERSCYKRSDSLLCAVKIRPTLLEPGKVVLPQGGHFLPTSLSLADRDFGFFVGAYLAEGCLTDHQVHISNVDEAYRSAARKWPDRHGIKSHVTSEKHRQKNNGTSISIMFHTTLVTQLLARTCGKFSAGKRVPGFAYAAPDVFVEGLLDGYFSGDGSINKNSIHISAGSRSRQLRDGIALLLTRFGIGCKLRTGYMLNHVQWTTEEDGRRSQVKYGEKTPFYELSMSGNDVFAFASRVSLVIDYKAARCAELVEGVPDAKRAKTGDFDLLNDVRLEAIVGLKEVPSSKEFVYDLTVAETRNMTATNGLAESDTFHSSGVSSKNVTLGIPRLKELIDASKSPKTPCVTLRFLEPYSSSSDFAAYVAATIPLVRLGDVVTRCDIVPDRSLSEEDSSLWRTESLLAGEEEDEDGSEYTVRLLLAQEVMHARHLTPPVVRRLLADRLEGRARVASSETNSVEWVVLVRFPHVREMMRDLASEQRALLCHRAVNVLLETVVVSGHPNLSSANSASAERLEGEGEEHVVHAYGGHFLVDCAASHCVDWARTTSNDVWEVYHTLGVEACAHVLFEQLKAVVSFDGTYVDDRHLLLIVDTMCRGGSLMPLNRHGINRTDASPFMRCSYEETSDVLYESAAFAHSENARGVTTSNMTGQLATMGTGAVTPLFPEPRDAPLRQSLAPKRGGVMRSTCRSFASRLVTDTDEAIEYRFDDPSATRPLSPPTVDGGTKRKRARFRPRSPG